MDAFQVAVEVFVLARSCPNEYENSASLHCHWPKSLDVSITPTLTFKHTDELRRLEPRHDASKGIISAVHQAWLHVVGGNVK